MQNQTILFVINEKSGNNQIEDLDHLIKIHAKSHQYNAILYKMSENAVSDIKQLIKKNNPEIVVTMGGDGTVNLLATILNNTAIKLLIVPYGSANGMAKELNMPNDVAACLELLVEDNQIVKSLDLVKINDKYFIHLADVGLNARIVYRFQQDKKRGLITYAKHLINEMFFIRFKQYHINYGNNKNINVKAVSLTFANAKQYGTGAIINPEGKLDDGFFEICVFKPFPRLHVFTIALQMFRNRLKFSEYFEVIKTNKAKIQCKKKCLLQFDGEVFGKTKEILLEVQKHALKVILPSRVKNESFVN